MLSSRFPSVLICLICCLVLHTPVINLHLILNVMIFFVFITISPVVMLFLFLTSDGFLFVVPFAVAFSRLIYQSVVRAIFVVSIKLLFVTDVILPGLYSKPVASWGSPKRKHYISVHTHDYHVA